MAENIYVIERGFKEGKSLTTAQRNSALFAEEPVVLGRVLRRGSKPMRLTTADFKANEAKLLAQEKAGAIKIIRPEVVMATPCTMCGQVPRGQGGAFKCPQCGLPTVQDLNPSGAGAPTKQEGPEVPPEVPAASPPPAEVTPEAPAVIAPPALETAPVVEAQVEVKVEEKVETKMVSKPSKSKK